VKVDLYRATGAFLGSKNYALRPWEVKQIDRVFTTVTSAAHAAGFGGSVWRGDVEVHNAGSANLICAIDLRVDLYRWNGSKVGSVPVHLKALSFHQVDRIYESVVGGDVGDGYATVACTTSGGKFLAFASVIDNRTGDPIYVPVLAITGGGGGGGADVTGTMGPGEVGSILDIFREAEDSSGENIGDVLVSIINDGMETALDHVAQQGASRITRGLAITVSSEASSGSINATYSGYTHTSSSAAWDYHVNMTDPVFRHRAVPFSSVSGHVSQTKHGSNVTADISVIASGSTPCLECPGFRERGKPDRERCHNLQHGRRLLCSVLQLPVNALKSLEMM